MKDGLDFSDGTRSQFFRPNATLVPPVHLDRKILRYPSERAAPHGMSLSALVNPLLKKDIERIEALE